MGLWNWLTRNVRDKAFAEGHAAGRAQASNDAVRLIGLVTDFNLPTARYVASYLSDLTKPSGLIGLGLWDFGPLIKRLRDSTHLVGLMMTDGEDTERKRLLARRIAQLNEIGAVRTEKAQCTAAPAPTPAPSVRTSVQHARYTIKPRMFRHGVRTPDGSTHFKATIPTEFLKRFCRETAGWDGAGYAERPFPTYADEETRA